MAHARTTRTTALALLGSTIVLVLSCCGGSRRSFVPPPGAPVVASAQGVQTSAVPALRGSTAGLEAAGRMMASGRLSMAVATVLASAAATAAARRGVGRGRRSPHSLRAAEKTEKTEKTEKLEKKESQSDDGFVMPRTPEEEQKMTQQEMWTSDFDRLSDSEKISDPGTLFAIAVVAIPSIVGAGLLLTLNQESGGDLE
eukprot:CAMPEP_0117594122 /NCGR_PEP_ID=MMETSP0784-20121206/73021_1 /TAXON_ID=39447 /ORGANISM="" /LENGTH=198 /DNA_ID=CAMNT_0005396137 /DNA_START=13 /DNA_END=609 /DNA_ORIENTATION=+